MSKTKFEVSENTEIIVNGDKIDLSKYLTHLKIDDKRYAKLVDVEMLDYVDLMDTISSLITVCESALDGNGKQYLISDVIQTLSLIRSLLPTNEMGLLNILHTKTYC